jgi:hypothetical protein
LGEYSLNDFPIEGFAFAVYIVWHRVCGFAFVSLFEVRYKKGLSSFLGVPTRVSNDLLFPDFGFDFFVASRELGFLWQQVQHSDTLAAVILLKDRVS